jgi:hypothetical protein
MSTFTAPSDVSALALARSANANDLSSAVATAFALLPDETQLHYGTVQYGTCTGSGDAYVLTLPTAPASYSDGLLIVLKANHTNTGAATINVNSLGVKNLKSQLGTALVSGDLTLGRFYAFRYNSTSGDFELFGNTLSELTGGQTISVAVDLSWDPTPTLAGDLDTNENDIKIDDGHGIQDESGNEQITFSTTESAVNEFTLKNAATGNAPQIQATGGDTNIDIDIIPKGSGVVKANSVEVVTISGAQSLSNKTIVDENGNEQLKFSTTASAVNEITLKNAATGNAPQIQATGGDTNVDVYLVPKGTGVVQVADKQLKRPVLIDYGEAVNNIGSIGGGTQDIDLESGNIVLATVDTAETTFTFSNPPASGTLGSFTLILTNGGSQTVNWPGSVDWPYAAAPTLTAAGVDILSFATTDGGTNWYGFVGGLSWS